MSVKIVENWTALLEKQLKEGESLSKLETNTLEGITIKPFYNHSHQPNPTLEADRNWIAIAAPFQYKESWHPSALMLQENTETVPATCNYIFTKDKNQWQAYHQNKDVSSFYLYAPFSSLAEKGNWQEDRESTFSHISSLLMTPHTLLIDGSVYQNAGANAITQIGLMLLELKEYIESFGENSIPSVFFKVASGRNLFLEAAKIAALRSLVAKVFKAYNREDKVFIICEDSKRYKSIMDVENNLIRSTYSAVSGILGGASAIYLSPYDALNQEPNDFSKELAYKQLLLLKEEAYLNRFNNASNGAYYLSELVSELSAKSWELFLDWESQGGFLELLLNGTLSDKVKMDHKKEEAAYNSGEIKHIGVNIFAKESASLSAEIKAAANETIFSPIIAKRLAERIESSN